MAIARRACRGAESAPHRGRPMRRRIAAASRLNRGRIAAESPSNPWRIGGDSVTIGLRSAAALPARLARERGAANADADADADADAGARRQSTPRARSCAKRFWNASNVCVSIASRISRISSR
ncbi:hypothetical protein BOC48_14000 [Burkholderia pseudomallei]|nr:hypothetical protein BOC48_14000 [Burkholderia pseudomallei]ARL71077.1 hypothetical protein BOC54_00405 [Burkholderia pseudomallei]